MLGSRHDDPIYCEVLSLLDRISHIFTIGVVVGGLSGDVERGVGKAVVKVIAENSFPIVRQILFGVRLARLCAGFRKFAKRHLLRAQHIQLADDCPHALVDMNMHRQLVVRALIVVVHFGFNLDLAKSARSVESFQSRNVAFEQGLAVTAMTQKAASRLNLQDTSSVLRCPENPGFP